MDPSTSGEYEEIDPSDEEVVAPFHETEPTTA